MKTNFLRGCIAMAVIVTGLSSCLKSSTPPPQEDQKTYISIMQLAPTSPSLDVYFDATKVSTNPFIPGAVTSLYNALDKGAFAIKFKKSGGDSVVAELPVQQYDAREFYTILLNNLQADGPVNVIRIKDDFTSLTNDKAFYRFFHSSPNTPPVDLYINNTKVASARGHMDNVNAEALNKFVGITGGVAKIEVKTAGTDTVIATLDNVSLVLGAVYTIYLKGLTGGTGTNVLSIGILRATS